MSRQIIETLISRQLHQYNRLRALLKPDTPAPSAVPMGPVITISRMAGCERRARDLADSLAERLGVQVWGRELVDLIATDHGLRHELVSRLEQGTSSDTEDWVKGVLSGRMFLRTDYVVALAQTLKALADSGGAVVVGRGAGFILGNRAHARVRLVADAAYRMRSLMDEEGIGRHEAEQMLEQNGRQRHEFIQTYFRCDIDDVQHYDLVVNLERVPTSCTIDTCLAMVKQHTLKVDEAES